MSDKRKTAKRTDEALWKRIVKKVTAGDKGGHPGQWSARKAQLAVALYKEAGGGYIGAKSKDNSLAKWTRQKWRTKSGKPSLETGERYLPEKAIKALTDEEYRETTKAKRAGMRKGKQFVKQPKGVAKKVVKYRQANPDENYFEWFYWSIRHRPDLIPELVRDMFVSHPVWSRNLVPGLPEVRCTQRPAGLMLLFVNMYVTRIVPALLIKDGDDILVQYYKEHPELKSFADITADLYGKNSPIGLTLLDLMESLAETQSQKDLGLRQRGFWVMFDFAKSLELLSEYHGRMDIGSQFGRFRDAIEALCDALPELEALGCDARAIEECIIDYFTLYLACLV
jgi:hypothetical protein